MLNSDAERQINEHIATIMAFTCSRKRLAVLVESDPGTDWSYLKPVFFEVAKRQAERALLELGLYLRIVDDSGDRFLSGYKSKEGASFGVVVMRDGSRKALSFREAPNKIIHAASYRWEALAESGNPVVTCLAGTPQDGRDNWVEASIDLIPLFRTGDLLWLLG
jgi:hypothetical protein